MAYPATLDVDGPIEITRWRPLVQWLLAIPHLIILWFLGFVLGIVVVLSWFAIVFTGRLPQGFAGFMVMYVRWNTRVTLYAGFLHEEYPPFEGGSEFEEPGTTPVSVSIDAALEQRDRLTVGLRFIWMIPALIFGSLIFYAAQIIWFISIFVVLFTGRWNESMREFVINGSRVYLRMNAYALLLTDQYPPFTLQE